MLLGLSPNGFSDASWTIGHEIGHAIDDPEWGGVYSSQPEFNVRVDKNNKLPKSYMGSVMRELYDLYLTDKNFEFLSYPFDLKDIPGVNAESSLANPDVIRGEVFAQMFAAMLDENMRAVIKDKAPQTYSFMEDVFNDVKNTTFQRVTEEGREAQTIRRSTAFESNRGRKVSAPSPVRQTNRAKISFSKARSLSRFKTIEC